MSVTYKVVRFAVQGLGFACKVSGVCGDIQVLRSNASLTDKLLAAGDLGLLLPGLDEAAIAERLFRLGLGVRDAERAAHDLRPVVKDLGCITFCFPAGTQVATPSGHTPIEKLHVGDQVLTENPKTGKVEAEAVQAVRHDPPTWVLALTLADGSTIQVTPEHPFWVDRGAGFAGPGWLKASELRVGDLLRTPSGVDATIVGVRYHVARVEVYTLTLGANHDFFVGSARVLVHNCDVASRIDPTLVRFSQDSISVNLKGGENINQLAEGLRNGSINPGSIPPIRLVERDGQLFTLDNRRLEAFRRAGIPIPYRMATAEEIAHDTFKFTTTNGGTSIRVRGEP